MRTRSWTMASLAVFVALIGGNAVGHAGQTPEPVREESADQQGAAAGEAPPAAEQSARTPAEQGSSKGATARPARMSHAAAEHLDRIDEILREALRPTEKPSKGSDPVGTTGTPMTQETAETITLARAKLEEIRMHVEQARAALEASKKR
jgi:hypothetical protein